MSVNNHEEESSSFELPPDFEDYLNFKAKIPHKIKLVKSDDDKNNFINSTLYCLTNLKYFLEYLYKCDDLDSPSFKVLKQVVTSIYDNINNNKKEFNSYFFTKFILERIKIFENKLYHNPRILIDCILNNFFLLNNSNNLSSANSNTSNSNEKNISILNQFNLDSISSNNFISFSVKETYGIEYNTYTEDKISIVIKKIRKCSDINCGKTETIYKNMTTLHFNLKETDKEYSIYDCFDEFLKKKKMKKVNVLNVLKKVYALKTVYFINFLSQ